MDCSTARLTLFLSAENARDLDANCAKELSEHLAVCSECNACARTHRRLDQALGRAIRDVPVPVGLQARILERLADAPQPRRRRWYKPVAAALAAACVGLFFWTWYFGGVLPREELSIQKIGTHANAAPPRDVDAVNRIFLGLGAKDCAPQNVDYALLSSLPSLTVLPGYDDIKVPHLVFTKGDEQVLMFIVPRKKYRLDWENATGGYRLNPGRHLDPANPDFDYLILHTKERCDWLGGS